MKTNVQILLKYTKLRKKGKEILEFLETFQHDVSIGCEKDGHRYSHNGTISCIKCGMIKH